ncbi:MAG: bacteriohemerythrin [Gammaproteobacteria bacterium]|nr:bacteriohemerythrin [Gammaproteobacteria bacterium]
MTLLQWRVEFSVGVQSIDDEHRELIDLINNFYEKLLRESDNEKIELRLGDIVSAISMHFALEERLMRESNYEEYAAHKEDHEELLDQIYELADEFLTDPIAGGSQLEKRLSSWFAGHFAGFDARLHGALG